MSVTRYRAIGVGRGATLDSVETPLNDAGWLLPRLDEAAALENDDDRLAAIGRLVRWTDPGSGGYYDDLGNAARQPHLVGVLPLSQDPQRFNSPQTGFGYRADWRLSWMTHAETFWDTPLQMRYTGLDGAAHYRVRVVYAGDVVRARHADPAGGERHIRDPPADAETVTSGSRWSSTSRSRRREAAT